MNSNWNVAEKNGSFAKFVEMWCAEVPRGNICPTCVTRKQGILEKEGWLAPEPGQVTLGYGNVIGS